MNQTLKKVFKTAIAAMLLTIGLSCGNKDENNGNPVNPPSPDTY